MTIVAPMLDEARHVESFVADLVAQDYGGTVDLVVADGSSSDGSAELLEAAASRAGLSLTLVANPERFVSQGLNRCLEVAAGDLIVRLDCHSRYPADYIRLCVQASEETGAWNVGGVLVPQGSTPMERAVAAAMDGPFGGIGWTRAASSAEPIDVDTVTFGAFKPIAFEQVGLFDESLVRNQDADLNNRIRRAGGRVVLDPRIRVGYVPRGTWRGLFRQYYEYGSWRAVTMRKNRELAPRAIAPACLVVSVTILAILAPWLRVAAAALAVVFLAYLAGALVFGVRALRLRGEPLALLPRVLAAYAAFHVGHGVGMLRGLLR